MNPSAFILIGPIGAGKSTLFKALFGREEEARKTQTIEFEDGCIDTPGEYFSHPRLYHALLSTAGGVDTLVYVHPGNEPEHRMPPGLLRVYEGKRLVGAITKTDLPDSRPDRIEDMLRGAGFNGPIFRVSSRDRQSIERLKVYLTGGVATPDAGIRSAAS
ncbi:MAG: ethanolamine utilization protein EutP [Deltaproteobacteria bacterium]|jgi:ethanolamine utilization protein EutP|nr:ethanolamine utilization protein EutP [Deltaproteobacteria bacterium]